MRKVNITLILLACINFLHAQNTLVKQWDQRFGGTREDYIYSFQQTSDGGFMLGGTSVSDSSGDKTQNGWGENDYWIVKVDSFGNKQWDKDFGGTGDDILNSLQQTTDGGYILGGSSASGISGDKTQGDWDTVSYSYDYWIVKIDPIGNKQWDYNFGGTKNDFISSIQQTNDGGYILGGYSFSDKNGNKTQNSYGSYDYWIVKIDSLGKYQWDKAFGGAGDDELTSLKETFDGGYILGGTSASDSSGSKIQSSKGGYDYWVIKIDSLGSEQWQMDYGGTQDDILYSLLQTADSGYILAGTSSSGISGDKTKPNRDSTNTTHDYWMVKIDSHGTFQWDADFGGNKMEEQLGGVSKTFDGGYLLAGTSYSPISGDKTEANLGHEQTWIVKTDVNGVKEWDKTIFTTAEDESGYGIQTRDGGYLFANSTSADTGGYKTQECLGFHDFWMVMFRDTILTTKVHSITPFAYGVSVYPNPCASEITISLQNPNSVLISYTICDVLGKSILSDNENKTSSKYSKKIDLHSLSSGVYFLQLTVDGEQIVKKIVKD